MVDLNTLIEDDSDWVLKTASAITDDGKIIGSGTAPGGDWHGFLLVPAIASDIDYDGDVDLDDFELLAGDLERQIAAEEDRTGIKDIAHFAYSTFAKAALQRRGHEIVPALQRRSPWRSSLPPLAHPGTRW